MERRQGMRRHMFLLTEIKAPGSESVAGLAYNFSQDGMYVLTRSAPDPGANVYVRVPAPTGVGATMWLDAQVVHRSPYGAGLAFGEPDDMKRAFTRALL